MSFFNPSGIIQFTDWDGEIYTINTETPKQLVYMNNLTWVQNGTNDILLTTVPADEVWLIKSIGFLPTNTVPTSVDIHKDLTGIGSPMFVASGMAVFRWSIGNGEYLLQPNLDIWLRAIGATLNGNAQFSIEGLIFKIY